MVFSCDNLLSTHLLGEAHSESRGPYTFWITVLSNLNSADLLWLVICPSSLLTASLRSICQFWLTPTDHCFSLWIMLWVFYVRNLYPKLQRWFSMLASGNFVGLGFYIKAYDLFGLECIMIYELNTFCTWVPCCFSTIYEKNYHVVFCTFTKSAVCNTGSALAPSVPLICLSAAARYCHKGSSDNYL